MAQVQVCRTCLTVIEASAHFVSLDASNPSPSITEIKSKLEACVPEMTLDITKNPALCDDCVTALDAAYHFKKQCLHTEEKIYEYMLDYDIECVELQHLAQDNKKNIAIFRSETDDLSIQEPVLCGDAVEGCSSRDNLCNVVSNDNNNCIESSDEVSPSSLPPCYVVVTPLTEESLKGIECAESEDNNKKTYLGRYECSICNNKYKSKGKLLHHFRYHLKNKHQVGFVCYPHSASQAEPIRMILEWRTGANGKRRRCGLCTVSAISIEAHMRTHTGERPYSCDFCDYRATRKDVATKHMAVVHKKAVSQQNAIKDCNKRKSQIVKMNDDTQNFNRNESKTVLSNLVDNVMNCNRNYTGDSSKNKIRRRKMYKKKKKMCIKKLNKQHEPVETCVSNIYFKCVYCHFYTDKIPFLRAHTATHCEPRKYKCAFCEVVVYRATDLKYHTNLHSNKHLYQCDNCKYNTFMRNHFMEHTELHSSIKRYKCQMCSFSAITRLRLYYHKKKYHA